MRILNLQEKAGDLSRRASKARQQDLGIKKPLRMKNMVDMMKAMWGKQDSCHETTLDW